MSRIRCCYRYVVLTKSRRSRPFKLVSPLGTGKRFRAGHWDCALRFVANPPHAGKANRWDATGCVKWHVSIVEVAEVSRALSTVTSDLKSVPIGDTNIPATRLGDEEITSALTRNKKTRSEAG